jgi:hypothetical protein
MTTPRIPKSPFEYRLMIVPQMNGEAKTPTTLFVLETTQEFGSFRYNLVVQWKIEERSIALEIQGLKPQTISMPAFGPAQFQQEIHNLKGEYTVTIKRQDGAKHQFKIQILKKGIRLVKEMAKEKFVRIEIKN